MHLHKFIRALCPPFLWWLALKLLGKPLKTRAVFINQIQLRPNIQLRIHPDSFIPFNYFCSLNSAMVKEMDLFLELTHNKNTLLDVGALHGVFSLAFTANHPNRTSLAVDASPFAFARLLYNIHSNPSCRILSSEAALSDHKTYLKMNYEWEHAVASRNQVDNQLTVQALTGDELCQTKSFFPDVIKIDVEGHEMHVLRGLKNILLGCKPLLFIEIHPSRLKSHNISFQDILDFLHSHSYTALETVNIFDNSKILQEQQEDFRMVFINN